MGKFTVLTDDRGNLKMTDIEKLQEIIDSSDNIVFFGGAGVSTESGIPDFRSEDGLYRQNYDISPEEIISHSYFLKHPDVFYQFYKDKMIVTDAKPNSAHLKLAELERAGKLKAVITQNIDGLHTLAGSREIYEIHGSVHRNYCMNCGKTYPVESIVAAEGVPHCSCGGIIRPDVTLYEEMLNDELIEKSISAIENADTLIVAGTSLVVYPAAGFIRYFRGKNLVIINRDPTDRDDEAQLVMHGKVGEILSRIKV